MIRPSHLRVFLLLALCILAAPQPACPADPSHRSITLLDVDEAYINLDVDGRKVSIPLPEGYERAGKEDYPNHHDTALRKKD